MTSPTRWTQPPAPAPGDGWAGRTQLGPAPGVVFGGFWIRFVAYYVDAALVEIGTGGSTARLLGEAAWLKASRSIATGDPGAELPLAGLARQAGRAAGAWIGLAVRAVENGEDTRVELAAVGPWGVSETSQTAFLGGADGRRRAGVAAVAYLHELLGSVLAARLSSTQPSTGRQ